MRLKTLPQNCRHCQACALACSMVHEQGNTSLQKARLSISWEIADKKVTIITCRHCPDPKCLEDCPPTAITQNEKGTVIINEETCIGCGNCERNCPFGAIVHIEDRNKYQKCDLCMERDEGPICVEICPVNAIILE